MLHECPAEQKITHFVEGPRATLELTWQSGPIAAKGVIAATRVGRTTTMEKIGDAVLGARATFRRPCGAGRSIW
jgi:hypothetical protein